MRSNHPFAQVTGVTAGLLAGILLFVSPVPGVVFGAVNGIRPSVSARALHYQLDKDSVRDPNTIRVAQQNTPDSVTSLLLLGSSEFSAPVPQNPYTYLPTRVSDFDLTMSGRGYTQSLTQAFMLAAVEPDLKQRKVALVISPQWFTPDGIAAEAFEEVLSSQALLAALDSPKLSDEVKQRMTERLRALKVLPGGGSKLAPARLSRWAGLRTEAQLERIKAQPKHSFSQQYPVTSQAIPIHSMDWDAELRAAVADGQARISNNPYYVDDTYYSTYIAPKVDSLKDSMAATDYSAPSPEQGDLELFLDVAQQLGVEVLLVSVPLNAYWHDYAGYPAEKRAKYYQMIRNIADQHGVKLEDLSSYEAEPYFFVDVMHLGWKGWLRVTRACADFASH